MGHENARVQCGVWVGGSEGGMGGLGGLGGLGGGCVHGCIR